MAHVEESIVVLAPIGDVFDLIADDRRALSWLDGFSRFELMPGPAQGVGARVHAAGAFLGFTLETVLEIVDYQRPHRLISRSVGPITSTTAWLLSETEPGTVVTFTGDYSLPLALRIAGDRAFEQLVAGQTRRSLANLHRLFSARAAGPDNVLE
ncbi:MAG TPA: SRPBCC family protein [Chloroflexota bacterium]|nr:SRPBCC family protein [Chloroflexota bacterium]